MNYFLLALSLLLVMKNGEFTEGLHLSPLGVIHTCPSDQVLLNCVTNGMFLEWSTIGPNYSRQRLVTSLEIRDIPSLIVNRTTFKFVRESRDPLNITLFVINATVDWQISCTEYFSSTQNTLETTISIIEMIQIIWYLNASLDMIAVEPSFGEDNVTLHVRLLEGMQIVINSLTYGAILTSSLEETMRVVLGGSDGANGELTIPYNVQYNLTTFAVLCGYENQSDTLSLFYTNCGPPVPPPNGYVNAYNSTREGAEVNITCLSEPQQEHTMICSAGGQWEPDLNGFCNNVSESDSLDPLNPSRKATASESTWMIITITVTITSVSTFALLSIVMLIKLCQSKSTVSLPEPHLPDAHVYETVFPMEVQEENVKLNDNVAYETVRQLPTAI